jgi:hypothetical protein
LIDVKESAVDDGQGKKQNGGDSETDSATDSEA